MFANLSNNLKGMILALIGFSAFALADANAKYLMESYEPQHVAGIVAMFTSTMCILLSPFLGGLKKTLQTKKLKFQLARGLANSLVSLTVLYSFSKLTLAGTYSMLFAAPFIITLLSIPLFKEKVSIHGWIAIIAGFIGVLVVIQPGAEDINPYLFVPLLGAFLVAALFLLARPLDNKETLVSLAFYPAMSNVILITPVVTYLYGLPDMADIPMYFIQACLVLVGLTCTALAFRIAKSSIVSPFLYTEMIWAVGFDYFLFKSVPSVWTLTGAGIIIASGIYLVSKER